MQEEVAKEGEEKEDPKKCQIIDCWMDSVDWGSFKWSFILLNLLRINEECVRSLHFHSIMKGLFRRVWEKKWVLEKRTSAMKEDEFS